VYVMVTASGERDVDSALLIGSFSVNKLPIHLTEENLSLTRLKTPLISVVKSVLYSR